MALINSKNLPLKTKLQHFALEDPDNRAYTSKEIKGENGLLIFIACNHCPYTQILWERMVEIYEFAKKIDVGVLAINPNIHPNYPEDSPSYMRDKIEEFDIKFPYLIDARQIVVKSLDAVCTPEIFLFDKKDELFYHGRMDDSEKDPQNVKKEELREALMALFSQKEAPKEQNPSLGCSIKWHDTILG
ncbi:MAG: thioredoxin family protein [Proteobacteria bacterium]|nr:MAG: thioredoxin family protein [Pseudomonadota bacterium]